MVKQSWLIMLMLSQVGLGGVAKAQQLGRSKATSSSPRERRQRHGGCVQVLRSNSFESHWNKVIGKQNKFKFNSLSLQLRTASATGQPEARPPNEILCGVLSVRSMGTDICKTMYNTRMSSIYFARFKTVFERFNVYRFFCSSTFDSWLNVKGQRDRITNT